MSLSTFLDDAGSPSLEQCETVRAQAVELLEQICVHPATLPLQWLRDLHLCPSTFYRELLGIFAKFGDRHTQCQLPDPYLRTLVCLPFAVACFFENRELRIGVTGSALDELRPGDILTAWNGRSLDCVLHEHCALQLGANPEARLAKAIQTLPFRPLGTMQAPEDAPIHLDYTDRAGNNRRIQLAWQAGVLNVPLFASETDAEWNSEGSLRLRAIQTSSGEFGMIRIGSFYENPPIFLQTFLKCLERLPQDGLVLDLRGCEEGFVITAEQLLQLFTDQKTSPQPFEFRATRTIREIVANIPAFREWRDAFEDGKDYSGPRPLTSCEQANGVGRKYFGPVVVLVDALTYSSAEMFAAGIQDHGIGTIVGIASRTGGGGASPWSQQAICQFSGRDQFRPVPEAPSFRVAARRSRRVGKNSGRLLEGVGIEPDIMYSLNRDDFCNQDRKLLETVGEILAKNKNKR
ncbi:MAG TPA: S41 family peptidase [Bryobacteraceae bacterium]|nr:S41 family peptidase [Bryobacteraceae bacterium]